MTTYRIDDFPKSGKIRVTTPEQSRIVQNRLFDEGYKWRTAGWVLTHPHPHIIFWDADTKRLKWTLGDMLTTFDSHPNPEYTMSLFEPKQSDGDEWEAIKTNLLAAFVTEQYANHLIETWKSNYKITKR